MKPTILIIGASGSGKTTSLRNLPQDETTFLDTERKGLPFPQELRNITAIKDVKTMNSLMNSCDTPYRVVDSFTELSNLINIQCNKVYKGYDIWKWVGLNIGSFLDSCKSNKLVTIVTAIADLVTDVTDEGAEIKTIRAGVHGKMWEGKVESQFLIVLHCVVERDKKTGENKHYFRTRSTAKSPAKSPMHLALPALIDNDIMIVIKALKDRGLL